MVTNTVSETSTFELVNKAFQLQKSNKSVSSVKERKNLLRKLKNAILENESLFTTALYQDFKKHPSETILSELTVLKLEIDFAISNLDYWTRDEPVKPGLVLTGTKSWITYQPKGVCLIISPWNYPILLTLSPLVGAIAAGNKVIIKPSELTPNTSQALSKVVSSLFDPSEICLIEGDSKTSEELLKLPFNHIFFTGSPAIGKLVMKAASENLSSVTLELGGKSPVILMEDANLGDAVSKIAYFKMFNAGQTCIAPDYVYAHESHKEKLVSLFAENLEKIYGGVNNTNGDAANIVSERHFGRLSAMLADAKENGARVLYGGQTTAESPFFPPTILENISRNSRIAQEEIFGPILPIIWFKDIDQVLEEINEGEKPLSLYIFTRSKRNWQKVIQETRAGTTVINQLALQFANNHLPFGGDNHSGIGKSKGEFGFKEFSNARAVLKQSWPVNFLKLSWPPYTSKTNSLIRTLFKWL
jgi:aldehyde dehydrogenase (NAD+)